MTREREGVLIGKGIVRSAVLGLQIQGLSASQQLERLRELQTQKSHKISPEGREYLNRQVDALTEFCGARSNKSSIIT